MRPILTPTLSLLLSCAAATAHAHPGHLAAAAGHDHWVAGAAIAVAVTLAIWSALRGGKDKPAEGEAAETEPAAGDDETRSGVEA
jgi:hypothetical protein